MPVFRFLLLSLLLFALVAADSGVESDPVEAPLPRKVELPAQKPVALLYSPATRKSLGWRWEWEFGGARRTLDSLGVEYELLTPETLHGWDGELLVLPNIRNMTPQTVERIQKLKAKVLATYMTSYRNSENEAWAENSLALGSHLGVRFDSWVGSGSKAESIQLAGPLGSQKMSLGRGSAMFVTPLTGARVLGRWPGGEAAIVESEHGIYVGEDIFCPENSDSRPVAILISRLMGRLSPTTDKPLKELKFSKRPDPPAIPISECGRAVKVGVGTLGDEALFRAPTKLSVDGSSKLKFHRWVKGKTIRVSGSPYVEVLRLRDNGTYRWDAYRGDLEVSADGQIVNSLDLEEYIAGVVPGEVPSYFPAESLKAMAVVARTYAVSHMGRHDNFDVCDTVHCQVYGGIGLEAESTNKAVAATTAEMLTYSDKPVNALFHAVCGGATADSTEAWPTGVGQPYLEGSSDEGYCAHSGRYRWKKEFTRKDLARSLPAALAKLLGREYVGASQLLDIRVGERSASGRVVALYVDTPEKSYLVRGDSIRWLFSGGSIGTDGLQSTRFELTRVGDTFVLLGGGWGHGVGMCQQGANGRAKAGQSYGVILSHYYPHTSLMLIRTHLGFR